MHNQLPPAAQQPVLTVQVARRSTPCTSGSTATPCRPTVHRLSGPGGEAEARFGGGRADARRFSAAGNSRCAPGWIPRSWPPTASPRRMSSRRWATTTTWPAVGTTKGQMVSVDLTADTDLHSVEEFSSLSSSRRTARSCVSRMSASVVLGAENYDSDRRLQRQALRVHRHQGGARGEHPRRRCSASASAFPDLQSQLPTGLHAEIAYDATEFITTSIPRSCKPWLSRWSSLRVVIFLFLGSAARGNHPGHRHAAVPDRRLLHHAGARLLHQPADPAGAGAGHRTGGRRRHHRGRERRSAYEAGGSRRSRRRCRRRANSAARSSP